MENDQATLELFNNIIDDDECKQILNLLYTNSNIEEVVETLISAHRGDSK